MSLFRKSASLTLAFAVALPLSAISEDSDQAMDYASIMSRGFGISDEPSIVHRCKPGYEAIRMVELAGGRPLAIVRIENGSFLRRSFAGGKTESSNESTVSDQSWAQLVDLLARSGFWTYESDDEVWVPDGPRLWIEACLDGRFRSVSIVPDRDNSMSEIAEFLGSVQP